MMRAMFWALMSTALLGVTTAVAGTVTIDYPYIDVNQQNSDLGIVDTSGALTVQATASAIITGPGSSQSISPTATFTLTATYLQPDAQPGAYDFGHGSITISNGASNPLLTASFNDLVLQTGLGTTVFFSGPIAYTGGSLAGALPGGELEGSFLLSAGTTDLSQSFSGNNLTAKVGSVVPLPPSLPLMLSGLAVLGLGRRLSRQTPRIAPRGA